MDAGVAVKEEPSWSVPALELPPIGPPADATEAVRHLTTNDSYSPMLMSPAPSNLNTPRVSLSSHHSDFSARLGLIVGKRSPRLAVSNGEGGGGTVLIGAGWRRRRGWDSTERFGLGEVLNLT